MKVIRSWMTTAQKVLAAGYSAPRILRRRIASGIADSYTNSVHFLSGGAILFIKRKHVIFVCQDVTNLFPTFLLMAESLIISEATTREDVYQQLLPQIRSMVTDEPNLVANLANVAAALKEAFSFWWVGFYRVEGQELVLGPFQGPVACTRIRYDRGVCGRAWATQQTIRVPDVDAFPGHIACSSASRSEIVVPIFQGGTVRMVLDIDSDQLDDFHEVDERYLNELARLIEQEIL